MERQAEQLMTESSSKNMIDKDRSNLVPLEVRDPIEKYRILY
jgi:hypothetical protein